MNRTQHAESSFAITCPQLSLRQLLVAGGLTIAALVLLPKIWNQLEPFDPGRNYRTPYSQSEDYWLFRRLTEHASTIESPVLVIGDSVVWGEYVLPEDSLTAQLNDKTKSKRFMNAGINGLHPMAIKGLVTLHGQDLHDADVILHCNLLWLSSPERDLSAPLAQDFNHTTLVDQFGGDNPLDPSSPSYRASLTNRISIATTRTLPYRVLVEHVRRQYFGGQNLHQWTLNHPADPFWKEVTFKTSEPSSILRHEPVDWTKQGIQPQAFEWLPADQSLQFQALLRSIEHLQSTSNHVLVVIGPFNTHLLVDDNKRRFASLRQSVIEEFRARDIEHLAASVLPSEEYGDASHPLRGGYCLMADELLANSTFREFCGLR